MEPLRVALSVAWVAALGGLALLGAHRLQLVSLMMMTRRRTPIAPDIPFEPTVTVQLPLYDEATVVERLVDAACSLDWPRSKLRVQVLDDSDDETTAIVAERVEHWRARGVAIDHVRRGSRAGWKAGALAHGLASDASELVSIFDADFVPSPDFLRRTVPHLADPGVGLVQARWDHLNRSASLIARLQAVYLDAHFLVEQQARARSGRFFNFNGTAGVFRRAAIDAAGGWSSDTLTEDLDLSLRAQLAGWRFVFLDDVVAPGELPADVRAYRSQQQRWVKGSAQTARKLLPRIWSTPGVPLRARVEATCQLALNACWVLALALALLTAPVSAAGLAPALVAAHLPLLILASGASALFFLAGQRRRGPRALIETALLLPLLFAFGLGLSLSNARAWLGGLFGPEGEFVRTPKLGASAVARYRLASARVLPLIEAALGAALAAAIVTVAPGSTPFVVLVAAGFISVGIASLAS